MKIIEEIILVVIGGLFVAAVGHFIGQNAALGVIGGWVFAKKFNIKE